MEFAIGTKREIITTRISKPTVLFVPLVKHVKFEFVELLDDRPDSISSSFDECTTLMENGMDRGQSWKIESLS